MRRVIEGLTNNTDTAEQVCGIDCFHYGGDFAWEETHLYRTKKGRWFLAGEGGAHSRWAKDAFGGMMGGCGIEAIDEDKAKQVLEENDGPYELYFDTEEA